MSDKQQLAVMGAQYRLTEEQAKGLAERMPQTGALQVIDDEPMCMARRIEELEAQLAEKSIKVERLREMNLIAMKRVDGMLDRDLELSRLQSLMSEGWQLVPVEPTPEMILAGVAAQAEKLKRYALGGSLHPIDHGMPDAYRAMLAAAPSPDSAK